MNERDLDWNDLRPFLAVAEFGGLTAAALQSGMSPPTIGRRIQSLESALGQKLFLRLPNGYELTARGHELLPLAQKVEEAALHIKNWSDADKIKKNVKISAGSWTSLFLAQNIQNLSQIDDSFSISLSSAENRIDIARGGADIGIRNERPNEAWLAGKTIGRVEFAAYGTENTDTGTWIIPTSNTPSARWMSQHGSATRIINVSSPRNALDLVQNNIGISVFPRFIGNTLPELKTFSETIAELTHSRWLVSHQETRHNPVIRTVLRRISNLLKTAK